MTRKSKIWIWSITSVVAATTFIAIPTTIIVSNIHKTFKIDKSFHDVNGFKNYITGFYKDFDDTELKTIYDKINNDNASIFKTAGGTLKTPEYDEWSHTYLISSLNQKEIISLDSNWKDVDDVWVDNSTFLKTWGIEKSDLVNIPWALTLSHDKNGNAKGELREIAKYGDTYVISAQPVNSLTKLKFDKEKVDALKKLVEALKKVSKSEA